MHRKGSTIDGHGASGGPAMQIVIADSGMRLPAGELQNAHEAEASGILMHSLQVSWTG